ncbi:hypothetical protein BC940DRAFT_295354, partial [Gongronella butleri]
MILRFVSLALICSVERLLTSTVARSSSLSQYCSCDFFSSPLSRTSIFSLLTCRFLVRCVLSGLYGQTTSDAFTE